MDRKLGVGIIGVGYWGPNLVRNFSEIEESDLVCALNIFAENGLVLKQPKITMRCWRTAQLMLW
jgi:hypothetical protein